MDQQRVYIAIDLKSFYASVECMQRGLDPLKTHLVVADESRTEKTICLAVSPSLKKYGIPGRARLFEVIEKVKQINLERRRAAILNISAPEKRRAFCFEDGSYDEDELKLSPQKKLEFIIARPQMKLYMDYSERIFHIYRKFISEEDIHVYSVDECFMDVTAYLELYKKTPRELASFLIREVLYETGITATGGIGTNMYLSKVALDILSKHAEPDEHGIRAAELTEKTYREQLWSHRPIIDFWRVGKGTAEKLERYGMFTMGDVARCSVAMDNCTVNEELLYKLFGVNAELLIDHAWGREPCTIRDIKAYKPQSRSITSGQVLPEAYDHEKCRIILREMGEALALDLTKKGILTNQLTLEIIYDTENVKGMHEADREIVKDRYGRKMPKEARGSINLERATQSASLITQKTLELYERITDPKLTIRRIYMAACRVIVKTAYVLEAHEEQLDLFTDPEETMRSTQAAEEKEHREQQLQKTVLDLKNKYGKNALLRGTSFVDGATAVERNQMVGGHKA